MADDPVAAIARAAARRLTLEFGPRLPMDTEAALNARGTQMQPDPVSIASLLVAVSSLAWRLYADEKRRDPGASPEMLAGALRAELAVHPGPGGHDKVSEVVISEITGNSRSSSLRDRGNRPIVQKFSIEAVARQQVSEALQSSSARAATTIVGGHEHALRQTVIGLAAGTVLAEHDNPGEATLYVLVGRVVMSSDGSSWDARAGDLLVVPSSRHTVTAEEDSALLLTAVPRACVD